MTKKDSGNTRKENHILLRKLFIEPLTRYKRTNETVFEALGRIFQVEHRSLETYWVNTRCKIPGLLKKNKRTKLMGVGQRKLAIRDKVICRHDTRMPDIYEVQIVQCNKRYNEDDVFELDRLQWLSLKRFLTRIKRYSLEDDDVQSG